MPENYNSGAKRVTFSPILHRLKLSDFVCVCPKIALKFIKAHFGSKAGSIKTPILSGKGLQK